MKNLLVLSFFLLILLICNHESKNDNSTKINIDCTKEFIVGKWTICSNRMANVYTQRNVCIEIIFNRDGSGIYKYADSEEKTFKWLVLKGNKISIKCDKNDDKCMIESGDYITYFSSNLSGDELSIIDTKKDIEYFLERCKN